MFAALADGRGSVRIVVDPAHDPALSIWRGDRRIWQGIPRRWQPWKLEIADVDGDSHPEIIVGVWKSTRFFPRPHNCLYIYSWDGFRATPRWLGSALSRPFRDFAFERRRGKPAELISLERSPDGGQWIVGYTWNGFGFTGIWQRGPWKSARLVRVQPGAVRAMANGKPLLIRAQVVGVLPGFVRAVLPQPHPEGNVVVCGREVAVAVDAPT